MKLLRQTLKTKPDCSWEEYIKFHPSDQTAIEGKDLIRSTFDRFKSNREALLYWQGLHKSDQTKAVVEIRKTLDIPNEIKINTVKFLEDCIAISMDGENVNSFYEYYIQKNGEKKAEGLLSIGGFVDNQLFLSDRKGNNCRVIIFHENNEWALPHEREHIVFREYYQRAKNQKQEKDRRDQRIQRKEKFKEELDKVDSKDPQQILLFAKRYLKPTLDSYKQLFYEEVLSDIPNLNNVKEKDRYDSLNQLLEHNSHFLKLAETHFLGENHTYGTNMVNVVNGIRDVIMEKDLPYGEKLKICYELEVLGSEVAAESRIISKWLLELWNTVHGDIDEYTSILEVIPFKYISSIGYFINKDPKVFEADIAEKKDQKRAQNKQVLWRMMVRHAEDTPSIQQLPDKKSSTQKIKEAIEKSAIIDGYLNIDMIYAFLSKDVVNIYSQLEANLLKSLYPEYIREWSEYKNIGVPVTENEWLVKSFVEIYVLKLLDFRAIEKAISELLIENNLTEKSDEVIKKYRQLLEDKNGFGYKINDNADKVWTELENK